MIPTVTHVATLTQDHALSANQATHWEMEPVRLEVFASVRAVLGDLLSLVRPHSEPHDLCESTRSASSFVTHNSELRRADAELSRQSVWLLGIATMCAL